MLGDAVIVPCGIWHSHTYIGRIASGGAALSLNQSTAVLVLFFSAACGDTGAFPQLIVLLVLDCPHVIVCFVYNSSVLIIV